MARGTTPLDRGTRSSDLSDDSPDIVDWVHFEKSRAELGPGFIRILSYFREDGTKSVAQIEQAMREQNTVALIIPAHTLKGEARQFGAEPLATIAELIEQTARLCVETHRFPDELVPEVVAAAEVVQRDDRAVRQGDQPAADPRRAQPAASAARPATRASAGSRPAASSRPLLPHRLQSAARRLRHSHSSGPYWKRSSQGFDQASISSHIQRHHQPGLGRGRLRRTGRGPSRRKRSSIS